MCRTVGVHIDSTELDVTHTARARKQKTQIGGAQSKRPSHDCRYVNWNAHLTNTHCARAIGDYVNTTATATNEPLMCEVYAFADGDSMMTRQRPREDDDDD